MGERIARKTKGFLFGQVRCPSFSLFFWGRSGSSSRKHYYIFKGMAGRGILRGLRAPLSDFIIIKDLWKIGKGSPSAKFFRKT